jgi:hypothetical protein
MASRRHDLVSGPATLGAILLVSACAKLGHAAMALSMAASLYVVYAGARYLIAATPRPTSTFRLARCGGRMRHSTETMEVRYTCEEAGRVRSGAPTAEGSQSSGMMEGPPARSRAAPMISAFTRSRARST